MKWLKDSLNYRILRGVILKMTNIIKKLDIQRFVEILEDNKEMNEQDIKQFISKIELDEEFKKIFFYHDNEENSYFYESKYEQKLIYCLSKYHTEDMEYMKYIIGDYSLFVNYGMELYDCKGLSLIDFDYGFGSVTITQEGFYNLLRNEYLNNKDVIKRLISSDNFFDELEKVKKECLEYIIDDLVFKAKTNIKGNSMESIAR